MVFDCLYYGGKIKYLGFFCNKFKYVLCIWIFVSLIGGLFLVIMILFMIKSSIYLFISL